MHEINLPSPQFQQVHGLVDAQVFLKLESINMTGSIKYKTAISLLDDAEQRGAIRPGSKIIESSSGNLGIALAALCAQRNYKFSCVVDPNVPEQSKKIIETYGGELICVTKKDANGGYLGTRIDFIKEHICRNPDVYWTNQYANSANPDAHRRFTGPEIESRFPKLDLLVVGAGTTGTLTGCISYFGDEQRILAVDSVGSVTFGGASGPRYVPGLGTSILPPIFNRRLVKEHVMVPEIEAVSMCRWLASSHGYLLGGSTGTVLAGLKRKSATLKSTDIVVVISPDGGEKYLDTVYCDDWVERKFGANALKTELQAHEGQYCYG